MLTKRVSSTELTRELPPGYKKCASNCHWDLVGGGCQGDDMCARAVNMSVKPGCDFPRALIHQARDRVRHSEGSPAGARSSAISAVLLSVRENP